MNFLLQKQQKEDIVLFLSKVVKEENKRFFLQKQRSKYCNNYERTQIGRMSCYYLCMVKKLEYWCRIHDSVCALPVTDVDVTPHEENKNYSFMVDKGGVADKKLGKISDHDMNKTPNFQIEEEVLSDNTHTSWTNGQECTCANCCRSQVFHDRIYEIEFFTPKRKSLIQRKKFRNVQCSRTDETPVILCKECYKYLTVTKGSVYENMWPAFLWYFLSDEKINNIYGNYKWRFIPNAWRYWWVNSIETDFMNLPPSYFEDITTQLESFSSAITSQNLSRIACACNKYLMPTVLCPWGCSEYIHKNGSLHIDLVIQRYLDKVNFQLINNVRECAKVFSARDDYLRKDFHSYDNILLNPEWKVLPCVILDKEKGVLCLTCGNHNKGTFKKYLHIPRYPFKHNLPSEKGDQLCHATIRPRSISPMKASKYSNTYQMHEQRGCYQGIDTCSLSSVGNFSFLDPLLIESESLSLGNRSDIVSLLHKLQKAKKLSLSTTNQMLEKSMDIMSSVEIDSCCTGATYISIEDAICLQKKVSTDNLIPVMTENGHITHVQRNWLDTIIYSQKCDMNNFGAQFPIIGTFGNYEYSTRMFWLLSRVLVSVKELWKVLDEIPKNVKIWHGWIMTFLTRECFKDISIRSSSCSPFKYSQINSYEKLIKKFHSLQVFLDHISDIGNIFSENEDIEVVKLAELMNYEVMTEKKIIMVINDNTNQDVSKDDMDIYATELDADNYVIMNESYELRFVGITHDSRNNNINHWDGDTYFRHGGEYSKWWKANRKKQLPIHTCFPKIERGLVDILVYVRKCEKAIEDIRKEYLIYIGGQTHVLCREHNIPLIVLPNSNRTCQKRADKSLSLCQKKIYYGCPHLNCTAQICKQCFNKCKKNIDNFISPINVSTMQTNNTENVNEKEEQEFEDIDDENSLQLKIEESQNINILGEMNLDDDDTCFDEIIISTNNYLETGDNEILDEIDIPTTEPGNIALNIEKEFNDNKDYIDGHVILNQCGSLLSRPDNHIAGYRSQKHFLQRIASTSEMECVPLLYPEAMIFPSIFWKLNDNVGSFPGAIPSSLLATQKSLNGFASIKSHINVRLTNQFSTSSTSPSYISFQFDILSNLLMNSVDSRLVIARGLTCADGNIGVKLKSNRETCLHDSIDSKQMVKNLCASQKYLPMHFFLTFTVNQLEHFGVKVVKQWIDGNIWTDYYEEYTDLTIKGKEIIRKAMHQAAAPILLRNWMETRTFLIDYIYGSPLSPYHPVQAIFARDEYQKDKGNLPHIHLILSVSMEKLSMAQREKLDSLIRASVCSIRTYDEIEQLIKEGIFTSFDDIHELHKLASKILAHKCDARCQRRIGPGDGPENFRCRKINNLKISPDNTKNTYISIESKISQECMDRLIQIKLAEPIIKNKFGVPSTFKSHHGFFHPKRHIPPTNPNDTLNISPVEGYTFSILRSMQNIQSLTHTNGLNRYVCKYIGKIDEQNQIFIRSHPNDPSKLVSSSNFLHNTKVTGTAINEEKALNKKRHKHNPKGRAISLVEQLQIMLSYPQVRTDMQHKNIGTVPLEQRAGVEKTPCVFNSNNENDFSDNHDNENIEDGVDTSICCDKIRKEKGLDLWRQLRKSELIMLQGVYSSNISVDNITKFSLRPPELREIIDQVGNYYRWFYIDSTQCNENDIIISIDKNIRKSQWIDNLQRKIFIRKKALNEIMGSLNKYNLSNMTASFKTMYMWFQKIHLLCQCTRFANDQDKQEWEFISKKLLFEDNEVHLPIPVFSYVKPTMGTRFILHILLSLGHFQTELDLLLHRTLRDSLRYAKLIGPSNTKEKLQEYSDKLLKLFIEEQLVYFPNSSKVIQSWIVIAGELFDSIILNDEIPITDMPPILQTQLEMSQNVKSCLELQSMKKSLIQASFRELEYVMEYYNIPDMNALENATLEHPVSWDAIKSFKQTPYQCKESFNEQKVAVIKGIDTINSYLQGAEQMIFTKCLIIAGSPGSGKSFLEVYLALYAVSKGLHCAMTAAMSKRAVQLGGKHLHKLFCLPGHNKFSLYRLAEMALIALVGKAEKYNFLKVINILFIDEIGQVSAEMLGSLDIILRKLRNNDMFFGGLLIISTMDYKQLPPIKGKPFLTSPHVLTCFEAILLENSVRAKNDRKFCELQKIARMSPTQYIQKPELLNKFKKLLKETCTFVSTWDSDIITPDVHRIYGKKYPAKEASKEYILQVKNHLSPNEYVESESEDFQLTHNSHEEWQLASATTRKYLDHHIKEPRCLLFFKGAKYVFTYNNEGKFSQSQLCLLFDVPSSDCVNNFKKIPILVAPPGIKHVNYDPQKTENQYLDEGWRKVLVGPSPTITHSVQSNMKAQRKQYGLRPHVTSTVHASMGDTLHKVATEISSENGNYKLWDKAQVIVLLSRTKSGKDLIFVGNQNDTIQALCTLIQISSQWTEYMEAVLSMIGINTIDCIPSMKYFDYSKYPFRMKDISLPICRTGYVYMLLSTKDHSKNYIGQTLALGERLNQHNSGYGAKYTTDVRYRPWFLFAFVCGFDSKKSLMMNFESRWQLKRNEMIQAGSRDPKSLAICAQSVIDDLSHFHKQTLRLILLFR